MANTHELAHRTDVLNAQGYKNKVFVDAISDASKAVLDNAEGFQRVAQAVRSDLMKDILSALSSGRIDTGFGHKAEYWAKNSEAVPLEIFAELFTMETRNDSVAMFFIRQLSLDLGIADERTVNLTHPFKNLRAKILVKS